MERHEIETTTKEVGNRTYLIAQVAPLDVDGIRTVTVGSVMWLVGFVALLPFYGQLQDNGKGWWLWACLAGFGFGMLGLAYCRARKIRLAAAAALPSGGRRRATG